MFDPITLNRYLYCASDPVNHVDPTGHITLAQRQYLDRRQYGKAITNSVGYRMTQQNKSAKEILRQNREKQKSAAVSRMRSVLRGRITGASSSRGSSATRWSQRLQNDYRKRYCGLNPNIMSDNAKRELNHMGLDALGFIIPIVPDGLNALLYALEGDNDSAISSGISAITSLGGAPGKGLGRGAGFALKAGGKGASIAVGITNSTVKILGRGSTGRTEAADLLEQVAMKEVKANPLSGARNAVENLGDSRWRTEEGWIKKERVFRLDGRNIVIHFNYNHLTGEFDDFKFKD